MVVPNHLGGVETVLRTGSILTLHPSEGRAGTLESDKREASNTNDLRPSGVPTDTRVHPGTPRFKEKI